MKKKWCRLTWWLVRWHCRCHWGRKNDQQKTEEKDSMSLQRQDRAQRKKQQHWHQWSWQHGCQLATEQAETCDSTGKVLTSWSRELKRKRQKKKKKNGCWWTKKPRNFLKSNQQGDAWVLNNEKKASTKNWGGVGGWSTEKQVYSAFTCSPKSVRCVESSSGARVAPRCCNQSWKTHAQFNTRPHTQRTHAGD